MNAVAFDTHAAVKKLTGAGFSEQQAEIQIAVLVEAITGEFATQRDLKETETALRQDIEKLEMAIKTLRGDLERLIEATRNDFKHDFKTLRMDMKNMETRLMVRIGALMIVGITALGVLIKIL